MMESVRQWREVEADEAAAGRIAEECDLPLPLGRVLAARGLTELDAVRRFLTPRLSDLSDPFLLPAMSVAVPRVQRAVDRRDPITVFGDYDVDGITASALLVRVLRELGGTVSAFLPRRVEEGYGFTLPALQRCIDTQHPALIITVDCGVCSVATVAAARQAGIDVVVTDHHDVAGAVADAVAVVNPKLGNENGLKVLAGVGVAFKLCHALVKDAMRGGSGPAVDLRMYLDLVAAGTVADVAPLTGENRILVKHGLDRLNASPSLGLGTLAEVAGIAGRVESYHLGFVIGPRLNAAGRMGDAGEALELLLTDDSARARTVAVRLEALNKERKDVEARMLHDAVSEVDATFEPDHVFGIVAGRHDWHIGTAGIVASRLCRHYDRPSVVIGFDEEGRGRGSCRGIDGLNLVEVLGECADLLVAFGGHEMAAGLTVEWGQLEAFRERFNQSCAARLRDRDLCPAHDVDAWIGLGEADGRLAEGLARLAPLGVGNPAPLWGVRGVSPVGRPRIVGKDHLKLTVASGGTQMDSIGFGMAERVLPDGPLDLLFQLKENSYNGRHSLQLHVKDLRAAQAVRGGVALPA